jgi:hypothetical protein
MGTFASSVTVILFITHFQIALSTGLCVGNWGKSNTFSKIATFSPQWINGDGAWIMIAEICLDRNHEDKCVW